MFQRVDDDGSGRIPNPKLDTESSFPWRLPAHVAVLAGLGFVGFVAGIVWYDLDCGGPDECDGDGELAPLIGIVYALYAAGVGLAVIAIAEGWRAIRRF